MLQLVHVQRLLVDREAPGKRRVYSMNYQREKLVARLLHSRRQIQLTRDRRMCGSSTRRGSSITRRLTHRVRGPRRLHAATGAWSLGTAGEGVDAAGPARCDDVCRAKEDANGLRRASGPCAWSRTANGSSGLLQSAAALAIWPLKFVGASRRAALGDCARCGRGRGPRELWLQGCRR